MWVKARSWHKFATFTRAGFILTLCGRTLPADVPRREHFDPTEKTCETCLRIDDSDR